VVEIKPATCVFFPISTPTYKVSRANMGIGWRSERWFVVIRVSLTSVLAECILVTLGSGWRSEAP
jgi:hypothetical protein